MDISQVEEGNKQVPMVISGTSFNIVKLIQNNTSSIVISDNEELDRRAGKELMMRNGLDTDQTKEIKSIILSRYQKQHAETKEDKEKIKRHALHQYNETKQRKKRKLDIDLPINYKVKKYINDHIWKCTHIFDIDKSTPGQIEEKIANLPEKSKTIIKDKEHEYKTTRKAIETRYFGEKFSLDKIRESNPLTLKEMIYSRDIKKTRRERDIYLLS
jgi:hypothetical protein